MGALEFTYDKGELIRLSREGVTKSTFRAILDQTGMTLNEISNYIHTTTRTIQKKKDNDRLPVEESEKILAIARLYDRGEHVFKDRKKFINWMNRENKAMGNLKPISYLDLMEGINLVMDELTAIEHGFAA